MADSIFTKIINGDIPCHKIYEDEQTFAFLDIHPVQPGHVLVVSKRQVQFVWELEDDEYKSLMATCKKIANSMGEKLDAKFVGEQIIGIDVPHAHVHLIPFDLVEQFRNVPDMSAEPDHDALTEMAKKLTL